MTTSSHGVSGCDVAGKLAHRGRGLDKLEERVGSVCSQIETRLMGATKKIRLLEIGCGYGVALMQLRSRFRDRIELTGTNKEASHGDKGAMLAAAQLSDVRAVTGLESIVLPTITYCDAADGLPFDDCSFDVVVSQMCIQYVDDKILLLREAARVLRADGIAMIHAPLNPPGFPAPYALLLEIWDQGIHLTFWDYLAGCKGHSGRRSGYHTSVHLSHCKDFGVDLELVHSIQLEKIFSSWDGFKSIYRRNH
jgi:SAM-dependent methyltransferase